MKKSISGRATVRKGNSRKNVSRGDLKTLSGRDSSVLAVLAQSNGITKKDKQIFMAALSGEGVKIAKVMLGEGNHHSQRAKAAAAGFKNWAKSLSERYR